MNTDKVGKLLDAINSSRFGSEERAASSEELHTELAVELASQLATLSAEVKELCGAVTAAAAGSSRQANALVRWTKWYVFATVVLVLNAVIQPWWPLIQQWWRWGAFK
jgi:hypothetical protein